MRPPPILTTALAGLLLAAAAAAAAATPQDLLAGYGGSPQPARGEAFFNARHGKDWSCATCHTARPAQPGRHTVTGKAIEPLAPAANAQRFTDAAKTEKWFRRNCNDVLGRECSAGEKADVLAWLQTVK